MLELQLCCGSDGPASTVGFTSPASTVPVPPVDELVDDVVAPLDDDGSPLDVVPPLDVDDLPLEPLLEVPSGSSDDVEVPPSALAAMESRLTIDAHADTQTPVTIVVAPTTWPQRRMS